MNNEDRMIDSKYIDNNDHIKNQANTNTNDEMVNKLNSQNVVHSQPNFNLHKNPGLYSTSKDLSSNKNNKVKESNSNLSNKNNPSVKAANNLASNIATGGGLKKRLMQSALSNKKEQNSTVNALDAAKKRNSYGVKQGLAGRFFDFLTGNKAKESIEETNDGGGSFAISGKMKRVIALSALAPILMFSLIVFISIFTVYAALDHAGLPADDMLDAASDKIEKKLDKMDDDDFDKALDKIGDKDLSFANVSLNNSIYSIKLNNLNVLAKTSSTSSDFDFDIDMMEELYPPLSEYEKTDYSTAFYYKLSKVNDYYKNMCGKQVLDIPLLIITLKQESDDMSVVFASNLGYMNKIELNSKLVDQAFSKYYDYSYDFSDYQYSKDNSIHDMEILAQHMVSVRGKNNCTYSKDKYYSFLKEFIGKKYYSDITDEVKKNELIQSSIKEIKEYKELYNELEGINNGDDNFTPVSSNSYWWPIGSVETTTGSGKIFAPGDPQTVSTSDGFGCFAWRADKDKGEVCGWHRGVDISGLGLPPGTINVIAVKDGVVIYPTKEYQTQYEDHVGSAYLNNDGGGLGNYVMIEHSDGTISVYGHMAYNSITVMAGDVVNQGQVIGKVGHTGSSTAAHLHFGIKVGGNYVDPLNYINPDDPRPQGTSNFSLNTTTLSKNEFVAKMNNYCEISKYDGFCNILASNAELIYDVSLKNRVNPELVVVKAIAEAGWNLTGSCPITKNYWGIKITNGSSCSSGPTFDNLSEGIEAYASVISSYSPSGSLANYITSVYNERKAAGCDPAGYGLPGTMEGMQSVYSYLGNYRYSPGDWNIGGCTYYSYFLNKEYQNYCSIKPVCTDYKNCPAESKTTVCEQNEYTIYRLQKQNKIRYDIFGL